MKRFLYIVGSILLPVLCAPAANAASNAHDFSFPALADGKIISLHDYAGAAILVVNTASQCGFTAQYDGLQKLYDKYKERGFVVLGVPSNNFGNQEPDDEKTIKHFCEMRFGITFPMTGKVDVIGNNAAPFYKWAGAQAGVLGKPKWNFHKYLIGPDGRYVDWFSSTTTPDSDKIGQAIEKILPR